MSKRIGSFADLYGRSTHLGWKDGLEFHLEEDGPTNPVLPHLKNLEEEDESVLQGHHLSNEEYNHYGDHHGSLGSSERGLVLDYKDGSSKFNVPLRQGTREGASIRIGSHHGELYNKEAGHSIAKGIITNVGKLEKVTGIETPRDMHVFRAVYPSSNIHRLLPGQKFTDHGFTGTSLSHHVALGFTGYGHGPIVDLKISGVEKENQGFGQKSYGDTGAPPELHGVPIVARIHVPAGTKGHYVDVEGDSEHSHEQEFLLHRGTTFQVDRHSLVRRDGVLNLRNMGSWAPGIHVIHMSVLHQLPKKLINHYPEPSGKLVKGWTNVRGSISKEYKSGVAKEIMKKNLSFAEHAMITESTMTQVGHQLGSNEGGIHEDENGNKHYVKFYQNPDQGKVEALAGKIYDHMGIHTVNPESRQVNGRDAVVARWNPHLVQMHHSEFKSLDTRQAEQIGRMFHAAVLTKNWDMVGLVHDNIVKHRETGDLYSVDHGGAFHFRARGGPKDYGPDIGEHHSLRHNDQASGDVFHHVLSNHPTAYEAGRKAVLDMDMDHVHGLFKSSGLHNWEDLHHNFAQRRAALLAAK